MAIFGRGGSIDVSRRCSRSALGQWNWTPRTFRFWFSHFITLVVVCAGPRIFCECWTRLWYGAGYPRVAS